MLKTYIQTNSYIVGQHLFPEVFQGSLSEVVTIPDDIEQQVIDVDTYVTLYLLRGDHYDGPVPVKTEEDAT